MWYTILACVVVVALIVVGVAMVLLRRSSSAAAVGAPFVQAAQASSKAVCRNRVGVDGVTTQQCDDWAAKGSCSSADHAAYMRRYCELSCARAGAPVPCTVAEERAHPPEVYAASTPAAISNDREETSRTLHIHSLLDELTTIVAAEEAQERQELKVCTEYYAEEGRMNRAAAQLAQLEELEKLKSQLVAAELEHEHNEVLECQGLARAWLTTLTDGGASVSNANVKARLKLCPEEGWESKTCPGGDLQNCAEISSLSTGHTACSGALPTDNTFLVECVVPTCKDAVTDKDTTAKLAGYHPDIGVQSSGASELLVDYTQMNTVKCTVDPKWGTGCSAPRHDMVGDDEINYFDMLAPQTKAKAYAEYSKLTLENNFKLISGTGTQGIAGNNYMLRYANNHSNCTAKPVVHAGALNFVQSGIGVKGKFDEHQSTKTREYNQIVGPYELTPVLCRDACEEGLFGSVGDSATIHSEQLKTAQKYAPHYKQFFKKGATSPFKIEVTKVGTDPLDGKYEITKPGECDWDALPASGYIADATKYYGYYYEKPDKLTLSGTTKDTALTLDLMKMLGAFMRKTLKCKADKTVDSEDEARFQCLLDPFRYAGFKQGDAKWQLYTHGGNDGSSVEIFVQHNISVVHSCVSTCMNSGAVSPFVKFLQTAAARSPDDDSFIIDGLLFNHPDWLKEPLGARLKDLFKLPIPAGTGYLEVKAKNDPVCTDMVIPDHDVEFGRFRSPVSTARDYAALEDRRGCPTPTETAGSGYVCAAYAPKALAISALSDPCLRNTDEATCATTVACAWDGDTCTSVVCSGHNSEVECTTPQCVWSAGNCVQNPSQKKVQARCADGQVSRMGWCECTDGSSDCDGSHDGYVCVKAQSGEQQTFNKTWLKQAHLHRVTTGDSKRATIEVNLVADDTSLDSLASKMVFVIPPNASYGYKVTLDANPYRTALLSNSFRKNVGILDGEWDGDIWEGTPESTHARVVVKGNDNVFRPLNDHIYKYGKCFSTHFMGPGGVCVEKIDPIFYRSAANLIEEINTERKARGLYTAASDILIQNLDEAYGSLRDPQTLKQTPAADIAKVLPQASDLEGYTKVDIDPTTVCLDFLKALSHTKLSQGCQAVMTTQCMDNYSTWANNGYVDSTQFRHWMMSVLIESQQKVNEWQSQRQFCYNGRVQGNKCIHKPGNHGGWKTQATGYHFRNYSDIPECIEDDSGPWPKQNIQKFTTMLTALQSDTFGVMSADLKKHGVETQASILPGSLSLGNQKNAPIYTQCAGLGQNSNDNRCDIARCTYGDPQNSTLATGDSVYPGLNWTWNVPVPHPSKLGATGWFAGYDNAYESVRGGHNPIERVAEIRLANHRGTFLKVDTNFTPADSWEVNAHQSKKGQLSTADWNTICTPTKGFD